jgi:hypothetical protein
VRERIQERKRGKEEGKGRGERKRGAPHVGFTCGDFDFIAPEFFFASELIEVA